MSNSSDDIGALPIDNSRETACMAGLDFGLVAKHANASFTIETTFNKTSFSGGSRRRSKMSFNRILWAAELVADDDEDDERNEMRSPGCFPISISNVNTPKL